MKYRDITLQIALVLFTIALSLVLHSCANRGYPTGGDKDISGPEVIAEIPANYSTEFDKKRINIYFNEFVQLKEINDKFIISPPMKKKPKVRLKGKYIQVELYDTLKPNTTYSLDFADAIVDNNESNPLGFYRYVFSTGTTIDSLELSGRVINAESELPVLNSYVFLYDENVDSIPVLKLPDYLARTDSSGMFRLTNLRKTSYKVVAVLDENRDYKFTPEGEMVGFIDSLVTPVAFDMTRTDTITRIEKITGTDTLVSDSVVRKQFIAYGPSNLEIRLFSEKSTQLYMVNEDRKSRHKLDYIFSIPAENEFKVRLLNVDAGDDWYITEQTPGKDTIALWIRDSLVYKIDTLQAELSYLRSDSTGARNLHIDTSRYVFKDKKIDKKDKKGEKATPKIEHLNITSNLTSSFDIDKQIKLTFNEPIDTKGLDSLKLFHQKDSILTPLDYTIKQDSQYIRDYLISAELKPGESYLLQLDSARLSNIYGIHNNTFESSFKLKEERQYGKLQVNLRGVTQPTIIQLYKGGEPKAENGKVKLEILQEQVVTKDGSITFNYLQPGEVRLRAILDENNNSNWDTGLYLKRIQPERVIYLPGDISIKENFDVEQDFDLNKKD